MLAVAECCHRVPAHPPQTLQQALYFAWLMHELIEFEGEAAPGFELRPPVVSPATVRVRGPHSLLQTLSSLSTEPVRIDGICEDRKAGARLLTHVRTPDYGAVPIFPAQPVVSVALTVTEKPDERTIERVPVRLVALPSALAVI